MKNVIVIADFLNVFQRIVIEDYAKKLDFSTKKKATKSMYKIANYFGYPVGGRFEEDTVYIYLYEAF